MSNAFTNKVAIITGSSTGIGKNLAIQLGQAGAKVVLNARNKEKLNLAQQQLIDLGIECSAFAGDISDVGFCKEVISRALDQYGRLDILVHNAGVSMRGPVAQLSPEVIDTVFKTNTFAPYYLSGLALPELIKTKGSMVFVSSLAGLRGLPYLSAYSSSKMALTSLAESLRLEHSTDPVHIGIVYVGYTKNEPGKTTIGANGEKVELEERKGRFNKPMEEVAGIIKRHIEKRKKKTVIGFHGFLLSSLLRLSPGLVHFILERNMKKMKEFYK